MSSASPLAARLRHVEGLDTSTVLERFDGMEDLLEHMLVRFRNEQGAVPGRVREHLEAGNRQDALRAVHSLKGVAANLALTAVTEAAARLERALAHDEPQTAALVEEFERQLEVTLARLRALPLASPASAAER